MGDFKRRHFLWMAGASLFMTSFIYAFASSLKGLIAMTTNDSKSKKLVKIIRPRETHWVGNGFDVSTLFAVHTDENQYITPFALLDYAKPRYFPPTDKKLGVGEHPHRGFETVTFAIQGAVQHRDSAGGGGTIQTGGVQWMTAGSGVVHEEFHSSHFAEEGGQFEMVQLWVNLPATMKRVSPRYQSMNAEQFPVVEAHEGKAKVHVIAGEFASVKGPAQTFTKINVFEVKANAAHTFEVPAAAGTNTLVVQIRGSTLIDGQTLGEGEVAVFERVGDGAKLELSAGAHLLVLNGEPIDEPVVAYGPFVMNTREEIAVAFDDFQAGRMGQLIGGNGG